MRIVVALAATLVVGGLSAAQDKPAPPPTARSQAVPSEDSPVYEVGNGVKPPRAIETPIPKVAEEETKNDPKYKGVATLSMIVTTDGKPRDIKVTKSLGPGLDKKAIDAVKMWRFEPATKDGKPVMVKISVEVTFALY